MQDTVLTLEQKLKPGHTAVLIIDVQNDMCHPEGPVAQGGFPTSMMAAMRDRLGPFLEDARRTGALLIFVRAIHDLVYASPVYAEQLQKQGTYGKAFLSGTWGADYWEDIRPAGNPREAEIIKHRYSAFHGTELDLILRSNGIKTLLMTGTATGGCVYTTAVDGFFKDYYMVMVSDSVADRDEVTQEVFLDRFGHAYGDVLPSSEIVKTWDRIAVQAAASG